MPPPVDSGPSTLELAAIAAAGPEPAQAPPPEDPPVDPPGQLAAMPPAEPTRHPVGKALAAVGLAVALGVGWLLLVPEPSRDGDGALPFVPMLPVVGSASSQASTTPLPSSSSSTSKSKPTSSTALSSAISSAAPSSESVAPTTTPGLTTTPGATTTSAAPPPAPPSGPGNQLIALINNKRAAKGCPALRSDSRLNTAAAAHSADMAQKTYVSGTSPDGTTVTQRARNAGYSNPASSYIAGNTERPEDIAAGMTQSDTAPAMQCDMVAIGASRASSSGGFRYYWTAILGRS